MKTQDFVSLVCFGFLVLAARTRQSSPGPHDVIEECPKDIPQARCLNPPGQSCMGAVCPMEKGAQCAIDGCGGCRAVFSLMGKRLTKEDCEGCGSSFEPRDCEPCITATCPDHPDARCENRRCGVCKAAFFGLDRKEIKSCCNSDERCADGTRKFHCYQDPCDIAKCPGVPGAYCKPNYCGGCKAEFFFPHLDVKVPDGGCVMEECPAHLPQAGCKISGDCLGETCPLVPGAKCTIDGCNGACSIVFTKGNKRLSKEDCHGCPRNDRVAGCDNPCDGAVCQNYPKARCEPQTCGECKANFYGLDRKLITDCDFDAGFSPKKPCRDGSKPFTCFVDPCQVKSCPGVPDSKCKANYCGGCKAEFFFPSGTKISDSACNVQEPCPGDLPQALCMGPHCNNKKNCPMHLDAECFVEGCNRCTGIFHKGGKRLSSEECFGCPPGVKKMDCGDICANAHCPLFPNARCEARMCGECKAVFYGLDRKEIKDCCRSDAGGCPPGVSEHHCSVNPCDVASCQGEPLAECKPNYCGGCNAEFYLDGKKLTDMQCKDRKVTCTVPRSFPNGRISPGNRLTVDEGEEVLYKCNNGFIMEGNDQRECVKRGNRGQLAGSTPTCTAVRNCRRYGYTGPFGDYCRDECQEDKHCRFLHSCCHSKRGNICRLGWCGLYGD